jgi:hypothetical protein
MDLYINDFDHNGTIESILTYYWPDGKSHLFNSKVDITSQIPALKKKFLLYKDYAGKTVNDVFSKTLVDESTKLQVNTLASSWLRNDGNDQWTLVPLPWMAQLSPVFVIVVADFNNDQKQDYFTGGNFFEVKPDIGRLDANAATLFAGDGKGNYQYVPKNTSGLEMAGQFRDAVTFKGENKRVMVLAANNGPLICLEQR